MSFVKLTEKLYYGIHPSRVMPSFHVDHYVGFTEKGEMPENWCPNDVSCESFPIKDRTAPSLKLLTEIVEYVTQLEGVVYLYCKGGHGRSGTIASAVYGKMKGFCGKQALEYINKEWYRQRDLNKLRSRVRSLGSPQTDGQRLVVVLFLDGSPNDGLNYVFFYEKTDKDTWIYSNFYTDKKKLEINGEFWYNTEQYFQAMKFRGVGATDRMIEYSNVIKEADSPTKIFMLGRQKKRYGYASKWVVNKKTYVITVNDVIEKYKDVKMRIDWGSSVSLAVMINAVYHKFTQYPKLNNSIKKLQDNTLLVEHTKRDKIWADGGDCGTGKVGTNYLGKILTALSYVLKNGECGGMLPELHRRIKI
jgi:predicted NAD-dependent protein-ADP-ribosyltransferase YbiA (DUF1768 family)